VILGLLTLAAIAVFSRWLIRRALRPVTRMTAEAADWSEHDLSRRFFSGEPRDELSTLGSVFDALLGRLAQSLRREQQLTAEVSHELRTPLAKILAEAELATSREHSPREHRTALELIARYAQDLQRVIETLLASARATGHTSASTTDAREVAQRVVEPLRRTLEAQGKSIEVVSPPMARAAVDAELLERILAPLLENASRFARRQITLDIRTVDSELVFEVRDDGPGIAPGERELVFEPGFRGAQPGSTVHTGAGLGLPLVRRLAGAAHGEVEARESADGGRFVVRLPRG
jgi:signal transduction histidine kinase